MTRIKTILFALLLTLPVILFVAHHYYSHSPELKPTGFTVDENVLYMSYAHQYLDQGQSSLFYSNPFDGDPASPKIYFQPVNLLFAALMKSGADPGFIFSLFGLLMAFGCVYMGIRIIQHLLPENRHQSLISFLFTWGGGLTAITGLLVTAVINHQFNALWPNGIYVADPANGWWGLNWGRTLFIPLEAFYHFLFLLSIYLVLKQRWMGALLTAIFLSLSHPFTGIEFLLILNGWLMLEKVVFKNKSVPYWFFGATLLLCLLHAWYYLFYLNSFPEHKQIFSQYSAGWTYSFRVFIPAYCLVFMVALWSAYLSKRGKTILPTPAQRFFLCWAVIAFLLSKHEWFIKPMQPIHFTRGYVWAGLFLFALPGITWLLDRAKQTGLRKILLIVAITIFLSDNLLWVSSMLTDKNTTESESYITSDTKDVLNYLHDHTNEQSLLIGNSHLVNYLANVYSAANAWVSHPFNTPLIGEREKMMNAFFTTGVLPDAWKGRQLVMVIQKSIAMPVISNAPHTNTVFENNSYRVELINP